MQQSYLSTYSEFANSKSYVGCKQRVMLPLSVTGCLTAPFIVSIGGCRITQATVCKSKDK